jgi:hypothetical protein
VVVTEHDGVEVVRELFGVQVGPESALGHPGPEDDRDHLQPALLKGDEAVTDRPRPVVQLGRRGDEEAASGARVRLRPRQPTVEESPDSRLAAGRAYGRLDDLLDEALGSGVKDLELERFLLPEVSEEAALG